MKKIILLLLITTAIVAGCKKYPDGPLISLRSAKKRLYGVYNITKYTVNGVDSLSLLNDSLGLSLALAYDDVDNIYVGNMGGPRHDGKGMDFNFNWELVDLNATIKITQTFGFTIGTGAFGNVKTPSWTILKLSNKETEWKATYNGKDYFVDMIKIKKG